MIFHKLKPYCFAIEKMPTAFFRISRSSRKMAFSRFILRISCIISFVGSSISFRLPEELILYALAHAYSVDLLMPKVTVHQGGN